MKIKAVVELEFPNHYTYQAACNTLFGADGERISLPYVYDLVTGPKRAGGGQVMDVKVLRFVSTEQIRE